MRAAITMTLSVGVALGCAPDLTVHASRIAAPRVIAVVADPPEARPGRVVTFTAVIAGASGRDVSVRWSACDAPRSTSESATVSSRCLSDDAGALSALGEGVTTMSAVPANACMTIGPQTPPAGNGGVRVRAPDPDITGGWQLPVRLDLRAGADSETLFARYRVRCQPPDVPGATAVGYAMRYRENVNPSLTGVYAAINGATRELARVGATGETTRTPIGASRDVGLLAIWGAESAERYVRVDPVTRGLDERTESLEVVWFTDGGWFERDRTAPDGSGTASVNVLHIDATVSEARVWVVLRDDRGGVDVAQSRVGVGE